MEKKDSFEGRLERLKEIVAKVESGNLSLEESVRLTEEGKALGKALEEELEEARKRVLDEMPKEDN